MFSYDLKFLTSEETLNIKNNDFKSCKYETKKRLEESVYDAGKRSFCERRGGHWRAPRPRQIRQLESKLHDRNIVACEWINATLIIIVFSSGTITYLTVKPNTLDITQILFDRYCVGKLGSHTVSSASTRGFAPREQSTLQLPLDGAKDQVKSRYGFVLWQDYRILTNFHIYNIVVLSSSHLLFLHADRLATLVTFGKTGSPPPCRISNRDPHLQSIEVGGGTRRTERHVSWRAGAGVVRVLVWSAACAEPAPWSPAPEDRANVHLYLIEGQHMSLKAYHQLEKETLSAELSQKQDNIVHIVEQVNCHKAGVSLDWVRYDVSNVGSTGRATKLSSVRSGETRVSLGAPARLARRAACDLRLLLACIDGSLHLVHASVGLIYSTRSSFIATDVRWAGELVVAVEEGGRLQCFDRALSLLHHHSKCIDLAAHLRDTRHMQILATQSATGGPFLLAAFNSGPLALIRITHPRLITAWIQAGRSSNAVALLRAMDWDEEGTECLWAVNRLVCSALRSGIGAAESASVAQAALGAFLAPAAPLSREAARFAPPLHDLARKFFHHLLRRGCSEKALSLAVDLHAWDLCCDVRWAARRAGAPALQHEAELLAARYGRPHHTDSECSDSCSECSSHSYSASEAETNSSSERVTTEPPPLPRVSLPAHSTLLSVSITQNNEPASTNSIRPNLHQYLERDNTIWNTNVRDDSYTPNSDKYKPILIQNMKWHSVDNMSSSLKQGLPKHGLMSISEVPSNKTIDRRSHERVIPSQFRNSFQTELREETTNTIYRYHNSQPGTSLGLQSRSESMLERAATRPAEKNKVKFSNTVTVAVVSESAVCPEAARELADSLPLSPPHAYLAAFAPAAPPAAPATPAPPAPPPPPPAGTALDYIEV